MITLNNQETKQSLSNIFNKQKKLPETSPIKKLISGENQELLYQRFIKNNGLPPGQTPLRSIHQDSKMSLLTPGGSSVNKTPIFKNQKRSKSILVDSHKAMSSIRVGSPTERSSVDKDSLPVISRRSSNLVDRIFLSEVKDPSKNVIKDNYN